MITRQGHIRAVEEFQTHVKKLIRDAESKVDQAFHKEALEDCRPGTLRRYNRIYQVLQELGPRVASLPIRIPDEHVEGYVPAPAEAEVERLRELLRQSSVSAENILGTVRQAAIDQASKETIRAEADGIRGRAAEA